MSERRVNVRVQTVGGDAVKRELQDIGNTGKQGLAEIGEGAKRAGEGMDKAGQGANNLGQKTNAMMRSGGMRNLSQQLSQVAQSGMASGNWLNALAIQIPDIMLGFGAAGALAGAAAGLMLPLVANLITGGDEALLPVRTAEAIPLELHTQAMALIRGLIINAPIRMGDVVLENLLDTNINLVASMDIDQA